MIKSARPRTRRSVTAAAISTLIVALTACAAQPGTNDSNAASSPVGSQTPAASGTIDEFTWYGDYRAPYSLDPAQSSDYPEATAVANLCDPLIRFDAEYASTPGVAKSWEYRDDTTLVFSLRDDVTFTDGSPVTAEDVQFSLQRNMDPAVGSAFAIAFQNVASIEASGPHEVTVKFSRPDATFLAAMATGASAPVSKKFTEQAGAQFGTPDGGIMCTGPYTVAAFDGVSVLRLSKNEHYWDKSVKVLPSSVAFDYPSTPQALGNGLMGGAIDGGFNLPAQLIPSLTHSSSGKLWIGDEGSSPQSLALVVNNLSDGALADPATRTALSAAIDRKGIADTVYSGAASPLFTLATSGTWGYSQDVFEQAYNEVAEHAASSQKATAAKSSAPIRIAYPAGDDTYSAIATIVQQSAKKAGLEVQIEGIPLAQYGMLFIDEAARAPYDAFLTLNYVQVREPAFMYGMVAMPDGVQNFGGYENPEVTALLSEAFSTLDDTKRAELVAKAQAIISEELPWIPLVSMRAVTYTSNEITGVPLNFSFMGQPWASGVGAPTQ